MVMVADEAAAAEEFSRAGFTVTPRSELPGMANRLICFPSSADHAASFIELLSVERPEEVPPRIRSFVGSMLGPVAIVLAVPDLSALQRRLSNKETGVFGPVEIRRQWTLPTGEKLDVALDILIGDDTSLPFSWAAVQHYTVEHYQRMEFTLHANQLGRLCAVAVSVEDPTLAAERMATLFGCAHRQCGTAVSVALENAEILLLPDEGPVSCRRSEIVGVIFGDAPTSISFHKNTYDIVSGSGIDFFFEVSDFCHLKHFECRAPLALLIKSSY
jgi:hypothetical protein